MHVLDAEADPLDAEDEAPHVSVMMTGHRHGCRNTGELLLRAACASRAWKMKVDDRLVTRERVQKLQAKCEEIQMSHPPCFIGV